MLPLFPKISKHRNGITDILKSIAPFKLFEGSLVKGNYLTSVLLPCEKCSDILRDITQFNVLILN